MIDVLGYNVHPGTTYQTGNCGDVVIEDVEEDEPIDDGISPEEYPKIYAGKYDSYLSQDRIVYEGGKTTTTADVPTTKSVAFTGQRMVELKAGFSSPEGTKMMAVPKPCTERVRWRYEYNLTDHLGNVRIRFADLNADGEIDPDTEVLGEHHYYAFGLEMEGAWNSGQGGVGDNRYRYNGKELNEDLGLYDYGARWYDPSIARWSSVDPLVSDYASVRFP